MATLYSFKRHYRAQVYEEQLVRPQLVRARTRSVDLVGWYSVVPTIYIRRSLEFARTVLDGYTVPVR